MEAKKLDDLAGLIRNHIVEFFHHRIEKELTLVSQQQAEANLKDEIYSAQILVENDNTNGVLAVKTDRRFLHNTHPERKYGEDLTDSDYLDWIGEIVNRLLGNMKNELILRGISTRLHQPNPRKGDLPFDEFKSHGHDLVVTYVGNDEFAIEAYFSINVL